LNVPRKQVLDTVYDFGGVAYTHCFQLTYGEWMFLKTKNCSVVCLRCGKSRPTLRKWVRRFQKNGVEGLKGDSKRPKSSPAAKLSEKHR
jgi:transposase